jgi:hypothetical protein|tara:strand:- start:185 stop:385 length:201 start_codon:yes stop_codon:yes gene_type:complete
MKDTVDNPHNATFYTIYDNVTGDDSFDGTYSECIAWKADMARLYPLATKKGRWGDPIWRKGGGWRK